MKETSTNKILHGDCIEIMKCIPSKSIDLILCDLPYGSTACAWDIVIPFDKLWLEYERIIKNNGAIVLTATNPFASLLINSNLKMFKYEWVWHKNMTSGFALAKKQPMRNHELILVFYKKQPTYNFIKEPRDMSESSLKRMNYDFTTTAGINEHQGGIKKVQYMPESKNMAYPKTVKKWNGVNSHKRLHPTEKPIEMFEYLIRTYTNEGDIVLDNCAGSGTTGAACIETGRDFILIEKDLNYIDVIKRRLL